MNHICKKPFRNFESANLILLDFRKKMDSRALLPSYKTFIYIPLYFGLTSSKYIKSTACGRFCFFLLLLWHSKMELLKFWKKRLYQAQFQFIVSHSYSPFRTILISFCWFHAYITLKKLATCIPYGVKLYILHAWARQRTLKLVWMRCDPTKIALNEHAAIQKIIKI